MTENIPPAVGVPGISGPPDWFNAPPTGSYRLDDVRWNGAYKRTFGGGASQSASFHAVHGSVGPQKYIFMSFRAAFVQTLSDEFDAVFLGLQKHGGTKAMVVHMQVHGATFAHAGPPPDSNPPTTIGSVQIATRTSSAANWTVETMTPAWIAANGRVWQQSIGDVPTDLNNRWAIQLRIPVSTATDITDDSGPNLGTDFDMWYGIQAGTSTGSPVILADYRPAGSIAPGTEGNYTFQMGNYPVPGTWDEFLLATGPATFGGVAIKSSDVMVRHGATAPYTYNWTIQNGQQNTFVARPRNYRTAGISAGDINATFRLANWGSVAGDANQVDWASGVWDYVPGNDATTPVLSTDSIPTLAANLNPPNTDPITLEALMNLGPNKSLHQCMLVTLSGTNLNFLNDSVFQNMNYDHVSLLEREAEISIVGLKAISPQPRDVYLAVEKVNMLPNTPGANEGQFLAGTMERLMRQGGALAGKLKNAQAILSDMGDYGSDALLENLLTNLRQSLAELKYGDREHGLAALDQLIKALGQWLTAVKRDQAAAKRLAALFDALADWLLASRSEAAAKLDAFMAQLNQWLASLGDDPASAELLPGVVRALRAWLSELTNGEKAAALIERLEGWLNSGRQATQQSAALNPLREYLSTLSTANDRLRLAIAAFCQGIARWLKGYERLNAFVDVLAEVGLTDYETDQLFPTLRIHVYRDTGQKVTGKDGRSHPVLRAQSSFGIYAYHEGELDGWQTSLQGAQRIADNLYLISVANNGTAKVNVRVQGVSPGEERIPEDKIEPIEPEEPCGCLCQILRLLGIEKKP